MLLRCRRNLRRRSRRVSCLERPLVPVALLVGTIWSKLSSWLYPTVSRASGPISIGYTGASLHSWTAMRCVERSCLIMRGRVSGAQTACVAGSARRSWPHDRKCRGVAHDMLVGRAAGRPIRLVNCVARSNSRCIVHFPRDRSIFRDPRFRKACPCRTQICLEPSPTHERTRTSRRVP